MLGLSNGSRQRTRDGGGYVGKRNHVSIERLTVERQ